MHFLAELLLAPALAATAVVARFLAGRRSIDVGLGPEPLINNIYHKKALATRGYSAETFVYTDNFISSAYDLNLAAKRWSTERKSIFLFVRSLFRYRSIFIYFNGGPLNHTRILRYLEPYFFRLAGIRIVAMPFGGDVQVMMRSPNLYFKHCYAQDNPAHNRDWKRVAADVDRWTRHADRTISGCEWVDYMYQWDFLQLAHFSIDLESWQPSPNWRPVSRIGKLRVFHAPNHKTLKGTAPLVAAIEKLKAEGLDIELVMLRGVPNTKIRETIEQVDLVADQFVIGWYAMFALEAMSLKKPVLCYLRDDLVDLYEKAGLVSRSEIPLISATVLEIEAKLRWAYANRDELAARGEAGREYVRRHHSLERIGADFAAILESMGLTPTATTPTFSPAARTAAPAAQLSSISEKAP